jgi:hypothetical protein
MPCPLLERFLFSDHARFEMKRRDILEDEVASVVRYPEQREEQRAGRCVYQSRVPADGGYLLRVFVDVDREPPEIVTAYRTSKIEKYWRPHARDL